MERFGGLRDGFRAAGHEAWSCDLVASDPPSPFHIKGDVLEIIGDGWDMAIFHPDCTYLTNSAAWAFGDGPYHQRVEAGTLVGAPRRAAREAAVSMVRSLISAPIKRKAIENPRGHLSTAIGPPTQTVHPPQFGDDASKTTDLWLFGLPKLVPTGWAEPRTGGLPLFGGDGKLPRWSNQTDSGQNKLSPSAGRAMERARTYPGIINAMVEQWGRL